MSRLSSRFLVWWVAVLLMRIKKFRNRSREVCVCVYVYVVEGGYDDFTYVSGLITETYS